MRVRFRFPRASSRVILLLFSTLSRDAGDKSAFYKSVAIFGPELFDKAIGNCLVNDAGSRVEKSWGTRFLPVVLSHSIHVPFVFIYRDSQNFQQEFACIPDHGHRFLYFLMCSCHSLCVTSFFTRTLEWMPL